MVTAIKLKDGAATMGMVGQAARLLQQGKRVPLKTLVACYVKCYSQMRAHARRIAELSNRVRFLLGKTADFR